MIIVSGFLDVEPNERRAYLDECVDVVRQARVAHGCIGFHLSADVLEPGRINVFEQWESCQAAEVFRGSGPSGNQKVAILNASVEEHEIATTKSLTS